MTTKTLSLAALTALSLHTITAGAVEVYGGVGTTGLELGLAQPVAASVVARIDINALDITHSFTTSDIDYDAKLKMSNVGAYIDYFVVGGVRLTGGALIGSRKVHGTARSMGSTIKINGVTYPVDATDTLDFDAKFPTVTPYLGVGFGHDDATPGFHVYADAGVAYGRPKVQLSPSASLAAKVNPADLASEQSSVQDKANDLRTYPVLKLGAIYRF
jgi:hypothetical protein